MRLIDADELWKDITSEMDDCNDVLDIIERQTVVDTSKELICSVNVDTDEVLERLKELGWEPAKHGRWIFSPNHAEGICTACNYKIYGRPYNNTYVIVPYNYCPNCGALMYEVEE